MKTEKEIQTSLELAWNQAVNTETGEEELKEVVKASQLEPTRLIAHVKHVTDNLDKLIQDFKTENWEKIGGLKKDSRVSFHIKFYADKMDAEMKFLKELNIAITKLIK